MGLYLPTEIIVRIIQYMDAVTFAIMRLVCHMTRDICDGWTREWHSFRLNFCLVPFVDNTKKFIDTFLGERFSIVGSSARLSPIYIEGDYMILHLMGHMEKRNLELEMQYHNYYLMSRMSDMAIKIRYYVISNMESYSDFYYIKNSPPYMTENGIVYDVSPHPFSTGDGIVIFEDGRSRMPDEKKRYIVIHLCDTNDEELILNSIPLSLNVCIINKFNVLVCYIGLHRKSQYILISDDPMYLITYSEFLKRTVTSYERNNILICHKIKQKQYVFYISSEGNPEVRAMKRGTKVGFCSRIIRRKNLTAAIANGIWSPWKLK